MQTAPGAVLDDFYEVFIGILLKVLAVIGQLRSIVILDFFQGIGQGHLAEAMVVPIAFPIGSDVHQLGELPSR